MIRPAVIRWYLYALYLRGVRHGQRWFRPRPLDVATTEAGAAFLVRHEALVPELPYRQALEEREFKMYSQNGEDGLISFIFSQVGTTNRRFLEFGVGDARECNCRCLAVHGGWSGLMLEVNNSEAERARTLFASANGMEGQDVRVDQRHVTVDNINEAIEVGGLSGEIDLLSVDIDGNDYWVWESIDVISPRVVVIEYNGSFGRRAITVPYDPDFMRWRKDRSGWYHGASVAALAKLGGRKGYDLVGTDSRGVNAFFVRRDIPKGALKALSPEDAYRPQRKRMVVASEVQQFDAIRHLEYVEV